MSAPYSLFEGIRKLAPEHLLRVGERGIEQPCRYWHIPVPAPLAPSPKEAIEQVAASLRVAVATALVANEAVGTYLSGGVDSSLIVALMSELRQGSDIKTFSAGFGDPRFDELPYARQVSQLLGNKHYEVAVTLEDFRSLWRRLTWHREATISEPADIAMFRLAELARRSANRLAVRAVEPVDGSVRIDLWVNGNATAWGQSGSTIRGGARFQVEYNFRKDLRVFL